MARASLTVILAGPQQKRALSDVLVPDNEGLPRGLRLSATEDGRRISYDVESESPSAAVSTALALLRDITLFQEVWLLSHGKDARGLRASS